MFKITAIIATSAGRTNLLLTRSLKSVYEQSFSKNVFVVVVDDNKDEAEFECIKRGIKKLRKGLNLKQKFPTKCIKNTRTKFHSHTGANNSGALFSLDLNKNLKNQFFAFLDDDDSWHKHYLKECFDKISQHKNTALVACGLNFITKTRVQKLYPSKDSVDLEKIFVKNPHIQGSNLFINAKAFFGLGGFDESLKSTTDRDLMMRYVEFIKVNPHLKSIFVKKALVNHFADENLRRVSNDKDTKKQGLDIFYRKYLHRFKPSLQEASLLRAKKLFDYELKEQVALQENKHLIATEKPSILPFKLALGLISYEALNLKKFLKSFFALAPLNSPLVKEFEIFILSSKHYAKEFEKLRKPYKQIRFKYTQNRQPIAQNRTLLQRWIYEETKNKDFVAWIVDDDMRFYCFSEDKPYKIDYFYHIARLKSTKIDALLCKNCDQPPLPFFSLLRTQLLDLHFLLTKPHKLSNALSEDFYYDLSSKSFMHLEYPFFYPKSPKKFINLLCAGQMASRRLEYKPYEIGRIGKDSIARGGNTLIFNPKLLKTKNFTLKKTKYNRRSDFNFAIINANLFGFDIKECNLPLAHSRGNLPFCYKKEWQKFKSDLLGQCFYRVFQSICENISYGKKLSHTQCKTLFYQHLDGLNKKLIVNTLRIQTLNKQIKLKTHISKYKKLDRLILKLLNDIKKTYIKYKISSPNFKQCIKYLARLSNFG